MENTQLNLACIFFAIFLQERRSNKNTVILLGLNLKSAGNYRCEVSAEAPLFNTVSQRSRMEVIVLPNSRPRISGGQHTYHVGDWVRVNCTSDKSKPAADLQWYINGREVSTKKDKQCPNKAKKGLIRRKDTFEQFCCHHYENKSTKTSRLLDY